MNRSGSGPVLTIAFLALSGHVASLLVFTIHEALGHGATALLLGGAFHDFYLNPLGGLANTVTSAEAEGIVSAAGALVTMAAGAVAWIGFGRRLRLRRPLLGTLLLWIFATEALLDSLGYIAFQPVLGSLVGVDTGDWLYLSGRLNAAPWILLALGAPVTAWLAARLARGASVLVVELGWQRPRSDLTAFWSLLLPGVLLLFGYLVVFAAWRDQPLPMALGSILGVPVLGLLGVSWPRRRPAVLPDLDSGDHEAPRRPGRRSLARGCAGLVVTGLVVGWLFGPTMRDRRGLRVGPVHADQYVGLAQELRIEVDLSDPSSPVAALTSVPRPGAGSPFRRELTRALAGEGPSVEAATRLTEFIARWNLDEEEVRSVSEPQRASAGWRWEAELGPWPDSAMIRLWPLTWVRESWIASLDLYGSALRSDLDGPSTPDGRLRWIRPPDMPSIDSFYVKR